MQNYLCLGAPLLDLGRRNLPQLVDRGSVSSHGALGHLNGEAQERLVREGVCSGINPDADDADAGVVLRAVVLAVAEVAHPRLEARAVVLLDHAAVRLDRGLARDRGPLTRAVDEANVNLGVALELVRLIGLGVGEEEQVSAIGLLDNC